MAFDEKLAARVRTLLQAESGLIERKMFGGICFMIQGHMAIGVEKANLMVRVGPEQYARALKAKHARPMDFTGRPLKGFVYVSVDGYKTAASLKKWVDLGVGFAKSLPRK